MSPTSAIAHKSPLHQMTQATPPCLWNDSASIQELTYSIEHGATGATCNPVIVLGVLQKEMPDWKDRIQALIRKQPTADEDTIAWQIVREISVRGAELLRPVFEAHRGKNGRLSIQTDPRMFRNARAIVRQAVQFNRLAPNMIVKIPITRAGIEAIEKATYQGVSINGTVSRCRSVSRWRRRWSPALPGVSGKARTSPAWARSAPSWWDAWTTG